MVASTDVLDDRMNSEVIELNDGQGVVVRVKEAYEPRQLDFDEVRSQIEIRLLQQKAELALSELAAELVQQVADGGEFTKVMVASGPHPNQVPNLWHHRDILSHLYLGALRHFLLILLKLMQTDF